MSKNTQIIPPTRKKEVRREVSIVKTEKPTIIKPSANSSYAERVQNYIFEYAGIAKQEMSAYGIPASITLAQGILESGAGYGELTSKAKNHFGIKCHDWEGDRVYHDDDRSQECFRKYDEPGHSFRDHSLFLKNRKRYAILFTYKQDDYKAWAKGLKAAGYATDPKYPAKLIGIIQRYNLDQYDKDVLGKEYVAEEPVPIAPVKTVPVKKEITVSKSDPKPTAEITANIDANTYTVQQGDTLYAISRKHLIEVEELKAYNNLTNNNIIVGQVLRLKPEKAEEF